ncbi:hypothetical protein FHS07_001988 [Microbacterium proteolyticum]|uniref:4Fe-4S Wbl-type domain-containing protein n=1 Tax=Microbacterium proteolyticum TaxID=1572644 RepID=A0A7W5GGI7_9MICO|nr:helix-turn-helix domain-containing protein [Microbacterium proteolyticum]MBB3158292.1 hypothetical protein [Microbacterium proteolyticum]
MPRWLTYSQAAERVRSHPETVKRWRRMGLSFALVDGRRMVREDALLVFWRERMKADPVHQARIARDRLQDASGAVVASAPPQATKRRQASAPRRTAAPRPQPARDADPLANVAPMRGAREFAALQDALREVTPSCDGMDAYTADRPSEDDVETMRAICESCPVLKLCQAYAAAGRPSAGNWPASRSDV